MSSHHDQMLLDFGLSRWFQYINSCLPWNVKCAFWRRWSIWLNVLGFCEPIWKSFVSHNLTNPNFFWCRYCKERGNLYGFENHGIISWTITTLIIFAFLYNLLVTLHNSALTKSVALKTSNLNYVMTLVGDDCYFFLNNGCVRVSGNLFFLSVFAMNFSFVIGCVRVSDNSYFFFQFYNEWIFNFILYFFVTLTCTPLYRIGFVKSESESLD